MRQPKVVIALCRPSPRCASAIQIVRPSQSMADTQPKLQPRFLRLSAIISQDFTRTDCACFTPPHGNDKVRLLALANLQCFPPSFPVWRQKTKKRFVLNSQNSDCVSGHLGSGRFGGPAGPTSTGVAELGSLDRKHYACRRTDRGIFYVWLLCGSCAYR
jgi:hypothetical protein